MVFALGFEVARSVMTMADWAGGFIARRQAAAVPVQAQLSLESSVRPAAAKAEPEQEGLKLSKSQLMRLRKKKREGKV